MAREIISLDKLMGEFCPAYRSYKSDGAWYLFRDIDVGDQRRQCQFGVADTASSKDDLEIIWKNCPEGSLFADVEPFISPEFDRVAVSPSGEKWRT